MIEYYQHVVRDLVRDDADRITTEQTDTAIASAVARYSGESPRTVVEELEDQSGHYIAPTSWVAGRSRLASVEYPVGEVPPALVPDGAAMVIAEPDGTERVALVDALPAASTVRVRFTAPHEVTGQADTIPVERRLGIALLAASLLCGQLASWYANQTDSTIAADGVEHKTKSELWASRERTYLKQAEGVLGMVLASAAPATEAGGVVLAFAPRRGSKVQRGLRLV